MGRAQKSWHPKRDEANHAVSRGRWPDHECRCTSNYHRMLGRFYCLLEDQRPADESNCRKTRPAVFVEASDSGGLGLVDAGVSPMAVADEFHDCSGRGMGEADGRGGLHLWSMFHDLGAAHARRQLEQQRHIQTRSRTGAQRPIPLCKASHLYWPAHHEPWHSH